METVTDGSNLETQLLCTQNHHEDADDEETTEQGRGCLCWFTPADEAVEEAKRQIWLAGPLIGVSLLQYSLQVIAIMFVGHLGNLPLSGASLASSFSNVTGFSVLLGMGSALETLCGQAYGAKQYNMLGIHTQRAMLVLLCLSIPLSLILYNTSSILTTLGQHRDISAEAGTFNRWMIPSVFAYGLLQCLNRFLQTQNNVFPMLMSSGATTVVHVGFCWVFVFGCGLGGKGAALAMSVSYWLNVILLVVYINLAPSCSKTWRGLSKQAFFNLVSFIKLAIPSAIMICFEYWSFEMVVLLSGLLPNPQLETSVLSISTRVANELGSGNPESAVLAVRVMMTMVICEGITVAFLTILVRNVWGKLYSNHPQVIHYVASMMPLLALSDFLDGFQCVLSGAARGCGWQNLCVFINLGAYYVVGIPSAVLFAFFLHIGGMGLWMGIICGLTVQGIALVTVNACTDWTQEARKAEDLTQKSSIAVEP
ncbi:protein DETOXIFICATION 16-like isoform X2 [Prosopis cineraria]|uniref:protein DETOXIFICATION 16-like isoform X2 n=1 Tax=Prosopis cineraria TaxID=364024 RepID=UPI00240F710A|nr:protein DETOXIFICATION 16-like isoform X2 [Prosopis cineraria]